jgi:hypothetical protein
VASLLKALSQRRVILLLDNLESVIDSKTNQFQSDDLRQLLVAFSRIRRTRSEACFYDSNRSEHNSQRWLGRQIHIQLEKGLSSEEALQMLEKMGGTRSPECGRKSAHELTKSSALRADFPVRCSILANVDR